MSECYVRLVELLCRRLEAGGGDTEQQRADRERAFEALTHAVRCGLKAVDVLALPGINKLRSDARFDELMDR